MANYERNKCHTYESDTAKFIWKNFIFTRKIANLERKTRLIAERKKQSLKSVSV